MKSAPNKIHKVFGNFATFSAGLSVYHNGLQSRKNLTKKHAIRLFARKFQNKHNFIFLYATFKLNNKVIVFLDTKKCKTVHYLAEIKTVITTATNKIKQTTYNYQGHSTSIDIRVM